MDFVSAIERVTAISLNGQLSERAFLTDSEVDQVYREMRQAVCTYLLYLGVSDARAQEVTQDVFLGLYQALRKGTPIENTKPGSSALLTISD